MLRLMGIAAAALLLAAAPAAADNYTHRSAGSGKKAPVTPAPEKPEPFRVEPVPEEPPIEGFSFEEEFALEGPVPAEPELALEEPEVVPPAPADPGPPPVPEPAGLLPVTSDFLPKPPPPSLSVPRPEKVLLDGKLPEGSQAEGEWVWSADPAGGTILAHSHLSAKGERSHRFIAADPVEMPGDGMIVQQIWLDPRDPPQGIALRFTLASGEEMGVYWEGEKEVFTPTGYQELWYYGMLPELGAWVSLEILAEDLGLEEARITGISFATFDGRALWGKTLLTEAPPLEGGTSSPLGDQE